MNVVRKLETWLKKQGRAGRGDTAPVRDREFMKIKDIEPRDFS